MSETQLPVSDKLFLGKIAIMESVNDELKNIAQMEIRGTGHLIFVLSTS